MTDLREIAEKLNKPHPTGTHSDYRYNISNTDVATLLNALVEERARGNKYKNSIVTKHENWTDNDWRTQALHELNLEGVGPTKVKP